jgi:hypothetical protein
MAERCTPVPLPQRTQRDYRPGERSIVRPRWFSEIPPVGPFYTPGRTAVCTDVPKILSAGAIAMAKRNPSKEKTRGAGPSVPGQPGHDEWLLDESVEESFPASDPVSPSRPGSTLGKRYQTAKKAGTAGSRAKRRTGG